MYPSDIYLSSIYSSSDRDLTYACVGIIVNMMSDPEQRPQFCQQVRNILNYNELKIDIEIILKSIKECVKHLIHLKLNFSGRS